MVISKLTEAVNKNPSTPNTINSDQQKSSSGVSHVNPIKIEKLHSKTPSKNSSFLFDHDVTEYSADQYKNQNDGLKWERPTYVVLRKYTDYKLNPYNIEKNFKFYDTHDAVDIDYVKHCPKIDYFTTLNSPKSKI